MRSIVFALAFLSLSPVTSFADIIDSADIGSPGSTNYSQVPLDWANIRNKPPTATRWPTWNEIRNEYGKLPIELIEAPDGFLPAEHDHDDRYLRLTGGAMLGNLRIIDSQLRISIKNDRNPVLITNEGSGSSGDDIIVINYNTTGTPNGGSLFFRKANGTQDAPEYPVRSNNPAVGTSIGGIHADGYSEAAGTWVGAAKILLSTDGSWNSGQAGGRITFHTSPHDHLTGADSPERVRIDADGNVGINTKAPEAKLHVSGGAKIWGGLDVSTARIPGDLDVYDNWPPGIVTMGTFTHDPTYPFKMGTVLSVNHSRSRSFQLFGAKAMDGSQADGLWWRNCTDLTLESGKQCHDWMRVLTERPSGRVGIGTEKPEGMLHVRSYPSNVPAIVTFTNHAMAPDLLLKGNGIIAAEEGFDIASENGSAFRYRVGGTTVGASSTSVFWVYSNGTVHGTSFNQTSDARLKDVTGSLDGAMDALAEIDAVRFKWNGDHKPEGEQIGLIAQDVQAVFPELVQEDEETGLLTVNYGGMVAPLISAVNELRVELREKDARIEEMSADLQHLTERAEELEALLDEVGELREVVQTLVQASD